MESYIFLHFTCIMSFKRMTVCAMPEFAEQKCCSNTLCLLGAQLQLTNFPSVKTEDEEGRKNVNEQMCGKA